MNENITIKTDHPFCDKEPDFTIHGGVLESKDSLNITLKHLMMNCSAGEDSHSDQHLINESLSYFNKSKINCLDLGCAGGQLILDYATRPQTHTCIGLDGSCGVYKHQNWHIDNNKKVLRHANLVEPFSVLDGNGEIVQFDIITCWEVIEHFNESDLDIFFNNVNRHLSPEGIFFGSIALFPDVRDANGYHQDCPEYDASSEQFLLHKTVFDSRAPWDKILQRYFSVGEYDFQVRLRNHDNSYYFKVLKK